MARAPFWGYKNRYVFAADEQREPYTSVSWRDGLYQTPEDHSGIHSDAIALL